MTAPDPWGIVPAYTDSFGNHTETTPETRAAIIGAMGGDPDAPGPPETQPVHVVRAGPWFHVEGAVDIVHEDGTVWQTNDGWVSGDLPWGYHQLRVRGEDAPRTLIVSPGTCWLPDDLRTWGWSIQLYAARSRDSWGIGDLADLRRLADWSARQGAGTLLVNPLDAVDPLTPRETSPYYPTSRRFLDPVYARIEEVPGADTVDVTDLAADGRALLDRREIDRDEVFRLKSAALRRIFDAIGRSHLEGDDFRRFSAERGADLTSFALHQALVDHHRDRWPNWPPEFRDPSSATVARFAGEHQGEVDFHRWTQWVLDRQLAAAGGSLALLGDLPIGADPRGADAWMRQDVLADGVSVGAPPDPLGPAGQDWQLPAFVPWKLRAAGYQPFVDMLRAAFRHVGGLRIDHVLGLFRLFWIPSGGTPADGAYVRMPTEDLLNILALESHRARAFVVGEDLGTVEGGVREELLARRILRYQVFWFEEAPIEQWATDALASVTTHDLPTIAGAWTGADAQMLAEQDLPHDPDTLQQMRDDLRDATGLADDADAREVSKHLHERLASGPNRLVVTQLEDALGMVERPNVPGTTRSQRANWSLALPMPLEDIEADPGVLETVEALSRPRG